MSLLTSSRRQLRVVAEADPGVLARVVGRFQNQNVVPRRVVAELGATGWLYIQVDVVDIPDDALTLIADKLRELPMVVNSHWHFA